MSYLGVRILFVNPITRYHDNARHTPLGILQLMAIVDRDWHWNQQLYDANAHRVDDFQHGKMEGLEQVIEAEDWDIFAIGGLITSYNYSKLAVKVMRRMKPSTPIVTGGGWFSAIPYDIMKLVPEIDVGVIGEAYVTFPQLIKGMENGEDISEVKGTVTRNLLTKELKFALPREIIPELDWLPFPRYKYAPLDIYFENSSILMSEEAMMCKRRLDICGSLGCGFLCLPAGTKIKTIDLEDKPIEKIQVGDNLFSYSENPDNKGKLNKSNGQVVATNSRFASNLICIYSAGYPNIQSIQRGVGFLLVIYKLVIGYPIT